jgi:hypothetical protein
MKDHARASVRDPDPTPGCSFLFVRILHLYDKKQRELKQLLSLQEGNSIAKRTANGKGKNGKTER